MNSKLCSAKRENLMALIDLFDKAIDEVLEADNSLGNEIAKEYTEAMQNMSMVLAALCIMKENDDGESLDTLIDDIKTLNTKMKADLSGISLANTKTIILKGGNS